MNTTIQSPTPDLKKSIEFYDKLGFSLASQKGPVAVSDGKTVIEINPERTTRAGVRLYQEDWPRMLAVVEDDFHVHKMPHGFIVSDPSGVWIYMLGGKGPQLNLSVSKPSKLGNFAGLSIETIAIGQSLKLWQSLGFNTTGGDPDLGWTSLSNGELTISLMVPLACPHLFFNPSLTYFNGKENLTVIENIRKLNIPIEEEITHFNKEGLVDNIIIRDPGGLGMFIFND